MAPIHATAIVDPKAEIGDGVQIGPYCVVGPNVNLGQDMVLHSHVVIEGRTRIGARSRIFPFASIGHEPQDLKYQGDDSELIVGADTLVREHVTMNPGTEGGGMITRIGNHCLFMMGAHVAHDCRIGDHVILANNATLGGHVMIEDNAIIGGLSAIHQYVRIGRNAIVGGMSGVEHDVIPYGMALGERAHLHGLNIIGLKRHGFDRGQIQALVSAFQILFADEDTLAERIDRLDAKLGQTKGVTDIVEFARGESPRALCRPKPGDVG